MSKSNFAWLLGGGVIGAVITWFCAKRYYEKLAQEEIDSVKLTFAARQNQVTEEEKIEEPESEDRQKADEAKVKPDILGYAEKLQDEGYTNYSKPQEEKEEDNLKDTKAKDEPYIISPDSFGENEEYERYSLTYYEGDEALVDDNDEPIRDYSSIIPADFVDHFGEYEDDSVFACNDARKIYCEILKDLRSYTDVRDMRHY